MRNISARNIEAAEKARQALELRKAGLGYGDIADRLGFANHSGAVKAVRSALRALVREPAEAVRDLELARLDALLSGLWVDARKGHVAKIDRVLKIMARRAELLGLDAPKTVKFVQEEVARLAAATGLDPADILAEAEAILAGAP